MHSDLFFFGSLITLIIGTFFDIRSSMKFSFYGAAEAVRLWQDEYGFFDLKKNLFWFGSFIAAMLAIKFLWLGNQTGIVFYILGAGRLGAGLYNESGLRKNRIKQKETLSKLFVQAANGVTDPSHPTINSIFRPLPIRVRNDRAFYKLFGWIFANVPVGTSSELPTNKILELRRTIIAHSQRPQSEWFPK